MTPTRHLVIAVTLSTLTACADLPSPAPDIAAAGSRAPHALVTGQPRDEVARLEQSLSQCVNFYLESEAADYFETAVGDASIPGDVNCGSDPLFYVDQTWECATADNFYVVSRFSQDAELPFETRRVVLPTKGQAWSFRCVYDSQCVKISCDRI